MYINYGLLVKEIQMIKKIPVVLLTIIAVIISCCVVGCSNDDGFEVVCSIRYTTNGEIRTDYSTWEKNYTNNKFITEAEYEATPKNKRLINYSLSNKVEKLSETHKIDKNFKYHTRIKFYEKTNEDDLKRYYWSSWTKKYVECELESITYHYILVKIIDNSTITIRTYQNETTYTVSSYSITYFKSY